MSDFINTIDKYGDEETLKRIIEGTIDEFCDDSITTIKDDALYYLPNLRAIKIPKVTSWKLHISDYKVLKDIDISGMPFSETESIIGSLKENNASLDTLKLNETYFEDVNGTIYDKGITTLYYIWRGLNTPTNIVLPISVSTLSSKSLQNNFIQSVVGNGVTDIEGQCFRNNNSLTSVTFPNVVNIKSNAFEYCSSLTSIDFPKATKIDSYAFNECSSLATVNLPTVISVGANAFYKCSSITSIDFPKATDINNGAFFNCSSLATVNLPNVISVGANAFYKCYNITSVVLTKCKTLGSYCLSNCSSLETVVLPNLSSFKGSSVFMDSRNLETLVIGGKSVVPNDFTNNFQGTKIASNNGYIYVPFSLVNEYKSATNWSAYASIIFPIGGSVSIVNSNNTVTITCDNPNATIKYKVNGGDASVYTEPFSINEGDVVYAYTEKFGITDGDAFINANKLNGKVVYIGSDNEASYSFYRADGSEIIGWSNSADLEDAIYYTKTGESTSDRIYVLGNDKLGALTWRNGIGNGTVPDSIYDYMYNYSKDMLKGKEVTNTILNLSDTSWFFTDSSSSKRTIWDKLVEYNSTDTYGDWYFPTLGDNTFLAPYLDVDYSWSCSINDKRYVYQLHRTGSPTLEFYGSLSSSYNQVIMRSF